MQPGQAKKKYTAQPRGTSFTSSRYPFVILQPEIFVMFPKHSSPPPPSLPTRILNPSDLNICDPSPYCHLFAPPVNFFAAWERSFSPLSSLSGMICYQASQAESPTSQANCPCEWRRTVKTLSPPTSPSSTATPLPPAPLASPPPSPATGVWTGTDARTIRLKTAGMTSSSAGSTNLVPEFVLDLRSARG